MEDISVDTSSVCLDFMMTGPLGEPLFLSFFSRSAQMVRSVGAGLVLEGKFYTGSVRYENKHLFVTQYAVITQGKERFTHGLAVAANVGKDYLITTAECKYKDLYALLMKNYALPLLERWMPKIMDRLLKFKYLRMARGKRNTGNLFRTIKKDGGCVSLEKLLIYGLDLKESDLISVVSRLFKEGEIWITKTPQKRLEIENMDSYFQRYGKSIMDNLKKILHPVSELSSEITRCTLMNMRLYPQQAAMVNGMFNYLKDKTRGSVLMIMSTGTGKTIQALALAEMLYVDQWLNKNPSKTLEDAYQRDGIINYRHIITAPGHTVEKWKSIISKEIPYAKAVIVDSFKQLVDIKAGGVERCYGKEFYIISKDFLKLSYQRMPTPKKEATRYVDFFICGKCKAPIQAGRRICGNCESRDIRIMRSSYKRYGLICPNCNRLLFKAKNLDINEFGSATNPDTWALRWHDMAYENVDNSSCIYCGSELWMPFVKNISMAFSDEKEPAWIRQTFWVNQAKRGKVTHWVLRGYEMQAQELWGECTNSMDDSAGGCRKYSPALYIKNQLPGFFDVFIQDELHKTKGGDTAQGNSLQSLKNSARYSLGLTGTITGGFATDLFYILFRLFPQVMVAHGYKWNSVMKFAEDFGVIESTYMPDYNPRMNVMSKGKRIGVPKVLPGISPHVFSEFLLDKAVFLDLTDMSEHMPSLYERIELCTPVKELEKKMIEEYDWTLSYLKKYEKDFHVKLTSTRNQFAMSYPDKPYGAEEIKNPENGDIIVSPGDYSQLIENGGLLCKEEKLLEIIHKELGEGRRCVVYVEYSQSDATNVLPRLREIILDSCHLEPHEVVVLYAGYPKAVKREEWMHNRAREGMKVMLCNPRLCETGLDFCWKEGNKVYNYPTLIFYQCGYSLYITWQAAGRSWRLNQREECRTYYLAYEKTVQHAILQVLGEKKAATMAIQGQFSAEGLAVMARGVDTQVRIAQIMSEMDMETGNQLQEMFDAVTGEASKTFSAEGQMRLFGELVKVVEMAKKDGTFNGASAGSIFDVLNRMSGTAMPGLLPNAAIPALMFNATIAKFNEMAGETVAASGSASAGKRVKKTGYSGTCSILD